MLNKDISTVETLNITNWANLDIPQGFLDILEGLGFKSPSPVQEKAIPEFSKLRKDPNLALKIMAPHGCGKTLAFALGLLKNIDESSPHLQAIILAPTRELALQIKSVLQSLAKKTSIKVKGLPTNVGTEASTSYTDSISSSHIFVSTPGYALNRLTPRICASVSWVLLDEADLMLLENSFRTQVMRIIKNFQASSRTSSFSQSSENKSPTRFVFFSATYPETVDKFIHTLAKGKSLIEHAVLPSKSEPSPSVQKPSPSNPSSKDSLKELVLYLSDEDEKFEVLKSLYSLLCVSQAIIFCNTIATAKRVVNHLIEAHYRVGIIYGRGMTKPERDKIMHDFREGNTNILVSTNLLARGIDVVQVNFVVNYDLPVKRDAAIKEDALDWESYVHRVGRGGRFGRRAVAVNLLLDKDEERKKIATVEKIGGKNVQEMLVKEIEPTCEEIKRFLHGNKEEKDDGEADEQALGEKVEDRAAEESLKETKRKNDEEKEEEREETVENEEEKKISHDKKDGQDDVEDIKNIKI